MTEMDAAFPNVGERFVGRYDIVRLIGTGGFAHVYEATQVDLGRHVAIKILNPDRNAEGMNTAVARFHQEARLVAQLQDPHTITMFDFGESESGALYMVFEYVDGAPLNRVVETGGPIAYERVVHIMRQILLSLHEAHSMGVMHRDIKLGNIMLFEHLESKDRVKVLDFGIAKTRTQTQQHTAHGFVVGTPRYMAPEQIRGDAPNPGMDIYSLGVAAYEMLTGKPMIQGIGLADTMRAQLAPGSFSLPAELSIPPKLRHIIDTMLEKDVSKRFHSAMDVYHMLGGVIARTTQQRVEIVTPAKSPIGPVWIVSGILVAFVLAGVLWLLNQNKSEASVDTTVTVDSTPVPERELAKETFVRDRIDETLTATSLAGDIHAHTLAIASSSVPKKEAPIVRKKAAKQMIQKKLKPIERDALPTKKVTSVEPINPVRTDTPLPVKEVVEREVEKKSEKKVAKKKVVPKAKKTTEKPKDKSAPPVRF